MTSSIESAGGSGPLGRRVVVTGGASGIGHAVVERLRVDGARVTALDLRVLEFTSDDALRALSCDVADEDSVAAAVEEAACWMGEWTAPSPVPGCSWRPAGRPLTTPPRAGFDDTASAAH